MEHQQQEAGQGSEQPRAPHAGREEQPARRGDGPSTERIRELAREVRDEGRAFATATRSLLTEVDDLARERLDAAPFTTLAVAFGFGVFLGGGLPFTAVRFAGRAAAGILIRQAVAGIAPAAAAARS